MIKHHPKLELIQAFVDGDLPASLSAGIAIHAEMCPECKQKIVQLTEHAAEVSFEEAFLDKFIVDDSTVVNSSTDDIDFEAMANLIKEPFTRHGAVRSVANQVGENFTKSYDVTM